MNLSITRKHCNRATKPCNEHCLQNNVLPSRNNTRRIWKMCGMIPEILNKLLGSPNRSLKWRKPSSNEKLAQKLGFQSLPLLHPEKLHNLRQSCDDEDGWSLAWKPDVEWWIQTLPLRILKGKRWDSRSGTPCAKQHCYSAEQQEEAKVWADTNNNLRHDE